MSSKQKGSRLGLLGVALLLMAARSIAPASAATYVMMSDSSLTRQSPIIVDVEVIQALPGPREGIPATDYQAVVRQTMKGAVESSTIVVRVPGGEASSGATLRFDGSPVFGFGDRLILFLSPNSDGSFAIMHNALGVFRQIAGEGRTYALRNLEGSVEGSERQRDSGVVRDYAAFARWLRAEAAAGPMEPNYLVPVGNRDLTAAWKIHKHEGTPIRWFKFDDGGKVKFRFRKADSMGTRPQFKKALKAWNEDDETPIRYVYGKTRSKKGHEEPDDKSAIIFGDPGDLMAGAFDCEEGGVVAMGGAWLDTSETRSFDGEEFFQIFEADIVVNDGVECLLSQNPTGAAEVFAHELGHTLGIDHSRKKKALMYREMHNDGRGAQLAKDDLRALRRLYRDDGGGTSGGDGGGGGEQPKGFNPPSNLEGWATSSTEGTLTWRDNSSNETEFRVSYRRGSGNWIHWASLPANATRLDFQGASPGVTYSFIVHAYKGRTASAGSNIVKVTMPGGGGGRPSGFNAPSDLEGWATSPTTGTLIWRDNSSNETEYRVSYRRGGGGWIHWASLPANATRLDFFGATPGITYTFIVHAYKGKEASDGSNQVKVTMPTG